MEDRLQAELIPIWHILGEHVTSSSVFHSTDWGVTIANYIPSFFQAKNSPLGGNHIHGFPRIRGCIRVVDQPLSNLGMSMVIPYIRHQIVRTSLGKRHYFWETTHFWAPFLDPSPKIQKRRKSAVFLALTTPLPEPSAWFNNTSQNLICIQMQHL